MKPSHFHSLYMNGRSDPQFEDADEEDNYGTIPGPAHAEMVRRGGFHGAGSRFGSSMAMVNPHANFPVHSTPSAVGPGHHRSLLLQSAMMNRAMVAVHPSSMRGGSDMAEAAYLANNVPLFQRPGAKAPVTWHQQSRLQEQQMALGAMQERSLPYRTSPRERMDEANAERHHLSRGMFPTIVRESVFQDSSRIRGEEALRLLELGLDIGPSGTTGLSEASLAHQDIYSTFRHPISNTFTPTLSPHFLNHPSYSEEEELARSRMQIVRPSEVDKVSEKTPIVIPADKKNRKMSIELDEGEWADEGDETGFNALLAASFHAENSTEKKRKTKAEGSSMEKKVKKPDLGSNATEFTTLEWRCVFTSLSLAEDKYWLSDLQCYIRLNFIEVFGATEDDLMSNMQGRSKPTFIGQVGIRCMHCKHVPSCERAQNHIYFPTVMSGIYNSVQVLVRTHLECCSYIPEDVREKIDGLKSSSSARGGRKQYWLDSAKKMGLCDTPRGIIFDKDPLRCKAEVEAAEKTSNRTFNTSLLPVTLSPADVAPVEAASEASADASLANLEPIVFARDKHLISEVLYLTFQNMHKVPIVESDQVGCYKNRPLGFIGLSCNHCVGQAGSGRYFPANEASLSQTTTSQTLLNHVRKCRRAPAEVGLAIESLMRTKLQKKGEKPRHGGRKVFFHRLWCRMQGLPEPTNDEIALEGNMRRDTTRLRKGRSKSGGSCSFSDSESEDEPALQDVNINADAMNFDGLPGNNENSSESESEHEMVHTTLCLNQSKQTDGNSKTYFSGTASLSQPDDSYWLSDLQCFVRSECLEAFSATMADIASSENILEGQVGIRCAFCAKSMPSTSSADYIAYPNSIKEISAVVLDLARLHFPKCPNMPENSKATLKSLVGYGSRSKIDATKYCMDAAKETGMIDWPDRTVRFFRDPGDLGAAERLFQSLDTAKTLEKSDTIVRKLDRRIIADHLFFLLSQLQICSYDVSIDRRRGRTAIKEAGFRGIECIHCADKGTKKGRYFPVSAKLFCDGTSPNIQNHLLACEFCPEDIKSSLEYLSHRVSDEKTRLRCGWRKKYYATLWKRIHAPNSADEDASIDGDQEIVSENLMESSDDSDVECTVGNAMIDAAARWLTELGDAVDVVEKEKRARGRKLS